MAATEPSTVDKKDTNTFKLLYSFENRRLLSASDKRRDLLSHFKQVKLYGDGSLSVYCCQRDAFPADIADVKQPLSRAWHVFKRGRGAAPELVESPAQSGLQVLSRADDADAFLGFGCLTRANTPSGCKLPPVRQDGTVDTAHKLFLAGDFVEQAWADSVSVTEKLQGNVLNAWWQEDVAKMNVQAVLESGQNDGNFSVYFMLTDKRVYVVSFVTS